MIINERPEWPIAKQEELGRSSGQRKDEMNLGRGGTPEKMEKKQDTQEVK